MNGINIEWNEIVLLVIGSFIGFAFSMATIFFQRIIDKAGSVRIYYKFTGVEDHVTGWGFYGRENEQITLWIPLVVEFENTKHSPVLLRDFKICLYNGRKKVADTTFIEKIGNKYTYGGEGGTNSFIIEGQGVKRYNCLYMYTISINDKEKYYFDSLKVSYYGYNGKEYCRLMRKELGNWEIDNKGIDKTFLRVN